MFPNADYERARYYPQDDRYLLQKPEGVEEFGNSQSLATPFVLEAILSRLYVA